jgi:anti-sigma regulatory factor (Ser/Thr protein kinase)
MVQTMTRPVWRRSEQLPPEPESVALARAFVLGACEGWGLSATAETAVLLVSEMTTNAVRFARTPVTVWLARWPDRVVLSVQDGSSTPPSLGHPDELDESGRGMFLVDLLADRWGERGVPDGKMVWAEISTV